MSDTDYTNVPDKLIQMELSTFEISLYLVYKCTTKDGKKCYKSLDTLSMESGMSRPSVIKARKRLQARGLIDVEVKQEGITTKQYVTVKDILDVNIRDRAKSIF